VSEFSKWRSPSCALSPTSAAARSRSRRAACAYGRCRPRVTGRSCAGRCARNARCASRTSITSTSTCQRQLQLFFRPQVFASSTRTVLATTRRPMSAPRSAPRSIASVLIWPDTRTELVAARCTSARCCLLLLSDGLLMTSLASLIASLIAPLIPLLMSCLRCPLRCPL